MLAEDPVRKYEVSEVKSLSRVRLFVTPGTVAYYAPPSMVVSRQEYWNGLPLPSQKCSIPIPKNGNAKESSNYHTIGLISHARKVTVKILQARFQ